jgi:archaetidylinositol phosphate synthase
MTLDQLRPVANRALAPFVSLSVRLGLTPNAISVIAFAFACGAAVAFALAEPMAYLLGALLVFLNGWLDLLDGAVAREMDTASRVGDLLDHVLDRYADIAILAGLAAGVGRWGLGLAAVTGVLMTSYLGTQAQAVGLGRVYAGVLGRADRLALVGLTAALAAWIRGTAFNLSLVGWLLVVFAVVGHLTALQRFWSAWTQLE